MTDTDKFTVFIAYRLKAMDRQELANLFGDGCRVRVLLNNDAETFQEVISQGKDVIRLISIFTGLYALHSTMEASPEQRLRHFIFWSFVRKDGQLNSLPFFIKLFNESIPIQSVTSQLIAPTTCSEDDGKEVLPTPTTDSNQSIFDEFINDFARLGGMVANGCRETRLDATSIFNSSLGDLKWALEQDQTFLTSGDKLRIIRLHRQYHS